MKYKKGERCRFCSKLIVKGEFRDTHFDGNLVCLGCYNELNSTLENKKKYNVAYHYSTHGRPFLGGISKAKKTKVV